MRKPNHVRIRISYDGKGPGFNARVSDADTGETISGIEEVVINATGIPYVVINGLKYDNPVISADITIAEPIK